MLFSHDVIRPSQKELVNAVSDALKNKKNLLAHAPTGLGKTAAVLCPAVDFALKKDLVVFFLTSRHTQHRIVLETAKKIMEKNNVSFKVASLIGKKWMCAHSVDNLPSSDFAEYCKSLVEADQCDFYTNVRGKNNLVAKKVLEGFNSPLSAEEVISASVKNGLCPYEMSLMLAEDSKVVVCDYFYLFNPHIRNILFAKIKKKLEQVIVIVDEGHNLPSRCRDLFTFRLSNKVLRLAVQEAKKYNLDVIPSLVEVQDVLNKISDSVKDERLVKRDDFLAPLKKFKDYDELVAELELAAEMVRAEKKSSHIGAVAKFLEEWQYSDEAYARFVSKDNLLVTLSNRCLDPAVVTKDVFDNCFSAVVMSGTLSPVDMYSDVLGLSGASVKSFPSPFPASNRFSLIVPRTTTKFSLRSEKQYRNIAFVVSELIDRILGCVMVFFPSYSVRDSVADFIETERPVFFETPKLDKEAKQKLLDKFASSKRGVLLGVAAGSFGEGIDLPGIVKGVIVVGLPLDKPDLETSELIAYYDRKFGKGWEYGYILPAMTRCIQNAGRCIRSEKDRGALVFVDERYAWPRYKSCFPPEWTMRISADFEELGRFFGKLA
ncbi:ATP-dependent DNA helicase [Candidatus Woesearchaeota archaeon]|nr:ATP-dependent DNA helicase [Candidatus Woesearchaeota archaeon]MBW3016137.1 ATP-dependent DNA helicase [Candidatus Woesearchaeota archaeon]